MCQSFNKYLLLTNFLPIALILNSINRVQMTITTTTTTTMTSYSNLQNYLIRSKIICSCLMNDLDDWELISCPNNLKLNIYSGFLFDSGPITQQENCTSKLEKDVFLKDLNNDLRKFCITGSNCSITKSFIINVKGDYERADCLSAEIYWTCMVSSAQNQNITSNQNFTYFFYIITLVLSSSCILVGALFILRRFLILRRRNSAFGTSSRTIRANQGYVPSINQTFNSSNGAIWTSNGAYGPPSYENIYDSSMPIVNNIPPPYDIVKNKKVPEAIVYYTTNSNNEQQQQQNHQQQNEQSLTRQGHVNEAMNDLNLSNENNSNRVDLSLNVNGNIGLLNRVDVENGEQVFILVKRDATPTPPDLNTNQMNMNNNGENTKNELVQNNSN